MISRIQETSSRHFSMDSHSRGIRSSHGLRILNQQPKPDICSSREMDVTYAGRRNASDDWHRLVGLFMQLGPVHFLILVTSKCLSYSLNLTTRCNSAMGDPV